MQYPKISEFLDKIFEKIHNKEINTDKLILDHVAYQTDSPEDFDTRREYWLKKGTLISDSVVGGRRVSQFKLKDPIEYKKRVVHLVELIEPKPEQKVKSAWEHIEMTMDETLEEFMSKYPDLKWNDKKMNRDIFPMLILELDSSTKVKFPRRGAEEEVERQKNME